MWGFAVLSMILEAIYFILLCIAYSDHDFSLVYPIARGAAPALLVLWSAIFLHEQLTVGGYIGTCYYHWRHHGHRRNHVDPKQWRKAAPARNSHRLTVAFIISVYTFVDGTAVKNGPALPYGLFMFVMMPFVTTPYLARSLWVESFYGYVEEKTRIFIAWRRAGTGGLHAGAFCLHFCAAQLFGRDP